MRPVFAEAAYMLRKGRYKLFQYADYEPQLFDLASDPEELTGLARRVDAKPVLDDLQTELHRICDPAIVSPMRLEQLTALRVRRADHCQQAVGG
jgi:choline-sulfatase